MSAQKHLGLDDDALDLVRSATYLPAWCYFSKKHKFEDKRALWYLADQVKRMTKNFSWERLVNDFGERITLCKRLK